MLKQMMALVVFGILAQTVFADEAATSMAPAAGMLKREGVRFTVSGAAQLARPIGTNSDLRTTFSGGISLDRFLTPTEGYFFSIQGVDRGFRLGSLANSASYLDIIFGFSSRYHWDPFSDSGVLHYRVGAFFGEPLSNFSGSLAGISNYSKTVAGFYVDVGSLYPIGEKTALGYRIFAKNALTDAIPTSAGDNAQFLEMGISLELTF